MISSGKVWGVTKELFAKNNVEVHRLEVNPGGYCSRHSHAHKHNMFFVERGKLLVTVWRNKIKDEITLCANDVTVVRPGEKHMFSALEHCAVLEIYWVEINKDDIERETRGGVVW